MTTFEVDVDGVTYEVDAPDENTAWQWANQTHASESSQPKPVVEPQNESLGDSFSNAGKGLLSGAADIGNTLINASTFIPRKLSQAAYERQNQTSLSDLITGKEMVSPLEHWNKEREASLKDFNTSNEDSTAFNVGRVASNIAGTAGVGNVLKVPALAANLPKLARALETGGFASLGSGSSTGNALLRLAAGAAGGASSAALVDPEEAASGGVSGALGTAILNPLLKGGSVGAGKLSDFITGKLPSVKAGQIARDVAGESLDDIRNLNKLAPDDLTSAQAAVETPNFEWSALGATAKKNAPTPYGLLEDAQENARLQALDDITPDLEAAVKVRKQVTEPLYDEALASKATVRVPPVMKLVDDILAKNPKNDSITVPLNQIKQDLLDDSGNGFNTNVGSLISLSQNIKNKLNQTVDGKPAFDSKVLTKIKDKLDEQIGRAEPKFAEAREKYKELSAPINQAQLLGAMRETLVNSKGGERVTPFLNALGSGEKSLFRKADQSPRFGSVDEVLSPAQRKVKDRLVSELRRDAEVARQAKDAGSKTREIVAGDSVKARLPSLVDRWFSAANKGIDIAETGINKKTMAAISEGMKSGKSANKMLDTLPAEERNKILRAIIMGEYGGTIPAGLGAMSAGE
jgi:hypothetical protein